MVLTDDGQTLSPRDRSDDEGEIVDAETEVLAPNVSSSASRRAGPSGEIGHQFILPTSDDGDNGRSTLREDPVHRINQAGPGTFMITHPTINGQSPSSGVYGL